MKTDNKETKDIIEIKSLRQLIDVMFKNRDKLDEGQVTLPNTINDEFYKDAPEIGYELDTYRHMRRKKKENHNSTTEDNSENGLPFIVSRQLTYILSCIQKNSDNAKYIIKNEDVRKKIQDIFDEAPHEVKERIGIYIPLGERIDWDKNYKLELTKIGFIQNIVIAIPALMIFAGISYGFFSWVAPSSFGLGVTFAVIFGVFGIKACFASILLSSEMAERYAKLETLKDNDTSKDKLHVKTIHGNQPTSKSVANPTQKDVTSSNLEAQREKTENQKKQ